MAEVPEVILKISVDSQGVVADIDKVKAKYGEIGAAVRENKTELASLLIEEKNLLAARAKTNSPTVIAQYNSKLKETRDSIAKVNSELLNQNAALKENAKQVTGIGGAIKKSFDSTLTKGFNGEILATRANYIKLRTELANNIGTQQAEKLAVELGKVKHELELASESAKAFGSENKFKESGVLLEDIGASILKLDFRGAASKAKLLADLAKTISFGDVVKSVKQLGDTLANVGQALIKNPLFLLVGVILAAVEITKDLIETDERYNKVLEDNHQAIEKVIEKTQELARVNRDLSLQNEIDAGKIGKVDGEKIKNKNKLVDAIIDLGKQQLSAEKKFNEDIKKAREEDGFKATKALLEKAGFETDITRKQKQGLAEIEKGFGEQKQQLLKSFSEGDQKIIIDEANATMAIIKQLTQDVKALKDKNQLNLFDDKTISGVKFSAEKQRQIAKESSDLDFKEKTKDLTNTVKINEIKQLEQAKLSQIIIAINKNESDKVKAIKKETKESVEKLNKDLFKSEAEQNKSLLELRIENANLESNGQFNSASVKRQLVVDYYGALKTLAIENKDSTILIEEQLKSALIKIDKDEQKEIFAQKKDDLTEEQRHRRALFQLRSRGKKEDAIILLAQDIVDEKEQLKLLEDSGTSKLSEIQKQKNKIEELEAEHLKKIKDLNDKQKKELISAIENLEKASIDSINKYLSAQINSFDRQTSAQQKRVDDAAKIAEGGNSQLLELEKKRLSDLNKEKERFVRAQQALAAIELIADTAVMIAKAGAEGGAGAAITIAAAVIALIAGLASARSIAGQAAFYKGGYTGDGNPNEVSTNLGAKNYQYHKEEFIHNHQTTRKYLKHFRDIHSGKMDLNEVVQQASLYKMLSANGIDFNRDTSVRSSGNYQSMDELKSLMRDTTNAIKNQDRVNVRIDENGLAIIATSYINKQKRLNNLAR